MSLCLPSVYAPKALRTALLEGAADEGGGEDEAADAVSSIPALVSVEWLEKFDKVGALNWVQRSFWRRILLRAHYSN